MTGAGIARLTRLLEGKYRMAGFTWTEAVIDLYLDALQDYDDDAVLPVVEHLVRDRRTPPDVSDILPLVKTAHNISADAYRMDFRGVGYERQRAGVTPFELMREGFESAWAERHPGQEPPKEWIAMLRRIGERKTEERRQAIARGDDPAGYDPFGEEAA